MKLDNDLLIWKCLKYFIDNPYSKIYLREYSRVLKISPNSAQRFLNMFLKEDLVLEERKSPLRYFKANTDSIFYRQIKKTYFIKNLVDSGIIKSLDKFCSSLVLFGSCSRGLNDSDSDMDIIIISKEKKKVNEIIGRFQKKFSFEISLHVFTRLEWKKQKVNNRAFYQEVVSSGIVLSGDELI